MSWKNRIREWRFTATVFGAALAFSHTIAGGCVIPSGSMQPTLDPADVVVVNRLAYGFTVPVVLKQLAHWADPQRGDVIIFNAPAAADAAEPLYIKRVVAVAGDVIEVRNNRVILNGQPVRVEQTANGTWEHTGRVHKLIEGPGPLANRPPFRIPAGNVFVMGDHRDDSADSRLWGPLPLERVRGKALAVALSFDFKHWKVGELL